MKYGFASSFLAGTLTAGSLVLVLTALDAGCTSTVAPAQPAPTAQLPDPGIDQEYEVKFPDEGRGAARYIRLAIGEDLSRDCGLVRAHFKFDSAEPLPQDTLALRDISVCLNRPEMQGATLEIVGRADARGNDAYNLELGRKRAENVKNLLLLAGVAEDRITMTTRGESDAVGDDKGMYSYGYDRRVDVVIDTPHRPR